MTIQRWLVTAAALTMVGVSLRAQTPAFEVASVKRLEEPPRNDIALFKPPIIGAIVNYRAVTVVGLIQAAYDVRDFQVVGAPEWAMKDWFEVQARAAGQPSANEMRVMLRSLLADRFGLITHSERRDTSLFALVVVRRDGGLGPFLYRTAAGAQCDYKEIQASEKDRPRPSSGYGMLSLMCGALSNFATLMSRYVDRPVMDGTGVTGTWSGTLYYTLDSSQSPAAAAPDPGLASLPTALQEQFGLKLEPTHGPVDVVVIDSIHPPTPN